MRTAQVQELMGKIISAQEEERKRVARELHDEVAQSIASLMLQLAAIEASVPEGQDTEQQRHLAQQARIYADRTLAETRRMIQDLRPSTLDDMGLVAAVRWYANSRSQATGTQVRFSVSGEVPALESTMETAVFRIFQEAISNATRHAQAHNIEVTLSFSEQRLYAEVVDDGVGFDIPEARAKTGVGIVGMEERAELIGGHLSIHSSTGQGTRVSLEVHLGK